MTPSATSRSSREGFKGRGIQVQEQASLIAERLHVIRSHETGIFILDDNTTFDARQLNISETKEASCVIQGTCEYLGGFGDGMVVLGGADVDSVYPNKATSSHPSRWLWNPFSLTQGLCNEKDSSPCFSSATSPVRRMVGTTSTGISVCLRASATRSHDISEMI